MYAKFLVVILGLCVTVLAGNPAYGAGPSPAAILVWGDSLSSGFGLKKRQEWPALLQTRLREKGFDYTVVNESVTGETTAGGLTRLPEALGRVKPAVLIIELGGNDGLRGLPPMVMADNLTAMVALGKEHGAKVLLAGMMLPPNYGQAYVHNFSRVYEKVAKNQKVALLPFLLEGFGEKSQMFQSDGIHPVAEAQPKIVDNIWESLQPLLSR